MGVSPVLKHFVGSSYAQLAEQIAAARAIADQLGDQSAVALLEVVERLCITRADQGHPRERVVGVGAVAAVAKPGARLSVHLLGRFRVALNGQPISGWRKKSEALFKYLVL